MLTKNNKKNPTKQNSNKAAELDSMVSHSPAVSLSQSVTHRTSQSNHAKNE